MGPIIVSFSAFSFSRFAPGLPRAQGFLPYFTDPMAEGTTSGWNARSFGGAMTGLAYGAIADPESKTVTKMMAVAALCLCLSIFLAITGGAEFDKNLPGTGINIWQAQIVPHLVVTGALLNAGFGGDDKTKSK